ncbi:transposase [Streptomyces atratus]|uniref:transposase n=1 Tax=Streptomyces atratus TaxID=1893 RepID=UPI00365140B4
MRGGGSRPREGGGADTGPSRVDRRKTGSKNHLICDGRGTPLKAITTAANVNDVSRTLALVDSIPSIADRRSPIAAAVRAGATTPCSATRAACTTCAPLRRRSPLGTGAGSGGVHHR